MVHRRRWRRRRVTPGGGFAVSAVIAGLVLAAAVHGQHPPVQASTTATSAGAGRAAAAAIAFTRQQIGKPYLWGGTGPDAFDCSGLVMMAYRSAGVAIARTSQQQWATERHVSAPQPGDLVFYPGSDGTWTAPGHVALAVGGGQMIEAYGTGYPVRQVPIRPGWAGFTDPAAGGAG